MNCELLDELLAALQKLRDQVKDINYRRLSVPETEEPAWHYQEIYQVAKNIDQTIKKIFAAEIDLPREAEAAYPDRGKYSLTAMFSAVQLRRTRAIANRVRRIIESAELN